MSQPTLLNPESHSGGFTTLSLAELRDYEVPEADPLVEDLLMLSSLSLVVGRPKAGKSLLAIDLLGSVALGETFLGRATRPGPVLYVPAEDSLSLVRSRLLTRLGNETHAPIHVLPADGSIDQTLRLDQPDSFARFAATIERIQPELAVLDPMRELHHRKENDADEMAALLRPLRQLAHEAGIAIVLIHHRNKHASESSKATRGSSAIPGGVDSIITIDTTSDDDSEFSPDQVLTLKVEDRYAPRRRFGARLRSGLRWEEADPKVQINVNADERIVRLFEADGELLAADDLAASVGLAKSTVQDALRRLVNSRKVIRKGVGTKADPYKYTIPQTPLRTNVRTNISAPESGKQPIRTEAEGYTSSAVRILSLDPGSEARTCVVCDGPLQPHRVNLCDDCIASDGGS